MSIKAISSWLSVLEASNQVAFLEPWFSNFGKRLVKSSKMYFCDTGLLCYLLGLTAENLATSPFVGSVWETFAFSELRKAVHLSRKPVSLWFYRDKQQVEVDFLVLGGGDGRLVECKWTENPDSSDTKSINRVAKTVKEKNLPDFENLSSFVVSRTSNPHKVDDLTKAIGVLDIVEQLDL